MSHEWTECKKDVLVSVNNLPLTITFYMTDDLIGAPGVEEYIAAKLPEEIEYACEVRWGKGVLSGEHPNYEWSTS